MIDAGQLRLTKTEHQRLVRVEQLPDLRRAAEQGEHVREPVDDVEAAPHAVRRRHALRRRQRLVQHTRGVLERIAPRHLVGEMHEVRHRASRFVRLREVMREAFVHVVEAPRVHGLHRFADRRVQCLPPRAEQRLIHDVADPHVREVEALAHGVEDAPPYELFDTFGRLAAAESGGSLEDGELEVARERRRDTCKLLGTGTQPIEASRDHGAHALGQLHTGGVGKAALAQRTHRLHDDEGTSLAERPHLRDDVGPPRVVAVAPLERPHERRGGGLRQPAEGDVLDVRQPGQLVRHPSPA